ncbi:hypothetical protein BDF21DRAFT_416308 [Thamnidium elegans]|nr:hypothetical protein BDF21DRAFT_416308 [Thamnidium elegans]
MQNEKYYVFGFLLSLCVRSCVCVCVCVISIFPTNNTPVPLPFLIFIIEYYTELYLLRSRYFESKIYVYIYHLAVNVYIDL